MVKPSIKLAKQELTVSAQMQKGFEKLEEQVLYMFYVSKTFQKEMMDKRPRMAKTLQAQGRAMDRYYRWMGSTRLG